MDSTFTQMKSPLFGSPKSSAFSPHSKLSTSRTINARKSLQPNVYRKKAMSGRYSISGRSNQSTQVVVRTDCNVVERFGFPLPVLVNEALTFSERNAVSIQYSNNGWAWAVCGRRLLIWQYKEVGSSLGTENGRPTQRRATSSQCRELTLPHCDIGHRAQLVVVFISENQQMPSCVSISPTGDVRYWPSIAHDGSSIDESSILEGQEFDEIISISNQGYILATTTCNLVHLQLQIHGGRHVIQHKTMKPPSGFFGGISKKFASIIIGMNHGHEKENKLLKICADKTNNEWKISILADRWIQRWLFTPHSGEQYLFDDHEITRKIRESFHQKLWSHRDVNEIEIWLLDMQPHDSNLIILAAGLNQQDTPQLNYALISLSENIDHFIVKNITILKHTVFYSPERESDQLQLKFIINRNFVYVYSDRTIYPIYLNTSGNDEFEKIDFPVQDRILSASSYHSLPLFFTQMFGIVSITPSDFEPDESFNQSFASDAFSTNPNESQNLQNISLFSPNTTVALDNTLSIYELDPEEIFNDSKDTASQLKAAFIYFLKKNIGTSNGILRDIFPNSMAGLDSDAVLDKTVIKIVTELAEDIPSADPRWEHEEYKQRQALGSSSSLQIIQQLKEKSLALCHFIEFLKSTKLWNRLSTITYKGSMKSTCHVVADIYEKIIAAIALKTIHNQFPKLIDLAIDRVLNEWNQPLKQNLTQQDLFYVRVTQIHDFFKILVRLAEDEIQKEFIAIKISQLIIEINTILLCVLKKVTEFREAKKTLLELPSELKEKYEYLPWTATSGKNGLKDTITTLIQITLRHGARSIGEPDIKQQHYVQLFELIDFLLDGRRNYLESIEDNEKYRVLLYQYESQRNEIIFQLVDDEQYELAAKLGEKYYDFHTLVVLCDRTKNQRRLDEYIERFKDKDFSQFAIQWHIKQNRKGDLFERFKQNQSELSKFLCDHPSLAWIQNVFNGDFEKASRTLFNLALKELEFVERKKTILSLSKLAALASEDDLSAQIDEINTNLNIIQYQEQLPINLLVEYGLDINNPKVLTPEEIISLYIAEENVSSEIEMDLRKSLELTKFFEDPYEMRHKIWCAAILRDKWLYYDVNAPLNTLQKLVFFKLVDLCVMLDGNLNDFLPPIEEFLQSSELSSLNEQKSFQYLLKLGYEHLHDAYNSK